MLGSRIERKRAEMHKLIEQGADPADVLKSSQELDDLIAEHYKALKQKGADIIGEKRAAQNPRIVHEG
jgi:phage shock protein A